MKPLSVIADFPILMGGIERVGVNWDDRTASYQSQADTTIPNHQRVLANRQEEKRSREVHFAVLPEKYEPLVEEDDGRQQMREEKKLKRKEKFKKYRKNLRKVLRYSWKCFMLGLQNFTVGYSSPLSAAATMVPEFHRGKARGQKNQSYS